MITDTFQSLLQRIVRDQGIWRVTSIAGDADDDGGLRTGLAPATKAVHRLTGPARGSPGGGVSLRFMVIRLPADCKELLDRQRGVLARWQAADCGLNVRAIDMLLRQGRWQTMYRGVYAAYTGVPSRQSVLWAAVR